MAKFQSNQFLSKKLLTLTLTLILTVTMSLTACNKQSSSVTDSENTNIPVSDIVKTMSENLPDFNASALMTFDEKTYSKNLPTLYKGLKMSDITDGAILYDETGNTADEISIVAAKDVKNTKAIIKIFENRASKRAGDFRGYKPEESSKAENAAAISCNRYVLLAIGEDTVAMQKEFQKAIQSLANVKE